MSALPCYNWIIWGPEYKTTQTFKAFRFCGSSMSVLIFLPWSLLTEATFKNQPVNQTISAKFSKYFQSIEGNEAIYCIHWLLWQLFLEERSSYCCFVEGGDFITKLNVRNINTALGVKEWITALLAHLPVNKINEHYPTLSHLLWGCPESYFLRVCIKLPQSKDCTSFKKQNLID